MTGLLREGALRSVLPPASFPVWQERVAAIASPKTFDACVALYGVSALLSLTGTALVIKRKKG